MTAVGPGSAGPGVSLASTCAAGTPSRWLADALEAVNPIGTQSAESAPTALDLACGRGRHVRLLQRLGYRVTAVDRDEDALAQCPPDCERLSCDLETDNWPLTGRTFDVVLVSHYLWRPQLHALLACVQQGGFLLYETFMQGNEAFGSPRNPDFLLRPGELLECCATDFHILRFEQGLRRSPGPAMVQRILAQRAGGSGLHALQSRHILSESARKDTP